MIMLFKGLWDKTIERSIKKAPEGSEAFVLGN